MNLARQKEKVSKLLQLIKEYPDHEIVPMVATECVVDDSFSSWMGEWGSAKVTKYWCDEERVYQYDDFDDLVEEWIDNNYEDYEDDPASIDELLEGKAREYVNSLDWKDAIIVYIEAL